MFNLTNTIQSLLGNVFCFAYLKTNNDIDSYRFQINVISRRIVSCHLIKLFKIIE